MAAVPPPAPARPSHRIRNLIILVVVVAIVVLVCLFTIPISTPYSAGFSDGCYATYGPYCPSINFPVGAHVTGTFSTVGGTPVGLQIVGTNGPIFNSSASSGSFRFTASNPPYAFAPTVVGDGSTSVSGHYTSPILVL
jgi:hypothetical protein